MKRFFIICPILIMMLTGCISQDVVESHISYYEGTIKEITKNTLILETPNNAQISFIASKQSTINDLEVNDIVHIECEEDSSTEIKNIVRVDVLKDSIEAKIAARMIYIHDNIYVENLPAEKEEREGIIDGIIDTSVLKNQEPTLHNQSNFGINFEYKLINADRIDVLIGEQWVKFIKLSDNIVYYNSYAFDKNDLSSETLNWLERYNKLSPIEKQNISFVPDELMPPNKIMPTSFVHNYYNSFIETEVGNIYIDIQNTEVKTNNKEFIVNINIINESEADYKVSEKDIQLIKMSKIGDGFSTVFPDIEASTALTTVPISGSSTGTLIFKTPVDFEKYEILIQTSSGMTRVPTPNN